MLLGIQKVQALKKPKTISDFITNVTDREWHYPLPRPFCVTGGCSRISTRPLNADLEISLNGALAKVTCHPGHVVSGTDQVSLRYSLPLLKILEKLGQQYLKARAFFAKLGYYNSGVN